MRLLSLLFLLALCGQVVGQRVVWEKRLSWPDYDELSDVVSLLPDLYLATGSRDSYSDPVTLYPSATLVVIDKFGDTLYVAHSGLFGINPRLSRTQSGRIFMLVQSRSAIEQSILWLAHLHQGGFVERKYRVEAFSNRFTCQRLIASSNGSLIMVGYGPDTGSAFGNRMYLASIDTSGLVYWSKIINENNFYTFGNHIEPTPRGTYLASGTAGSRIWAVEIDSLGNEIRRATFYHTPSNIIFDETASVKQGPNDTYVVSGYTQGSNRKYYLGLHQGWGGARIWGGERTAFGLSPHVNDDGSMVIYTSQAGDFGRFTKIDQDSVELWSVNIHSTLARFVQATAFNYLEDSSVVVVGYTSDSGPLAEDFYLARITGVGVPYDPAHPVATKPHLPSAIPKPYPNPCTTTLRFSSLTAQARLELYDMQGRQALSEFIQSRQAVDVSALPRGLYTYRLVSGSRVFVGRVIK